MATASAAIYMDCIWRRKGKIGHEKPLWHRIHQGHCGWMLSSGELGAYIVHQFKSFKLRGLGATVLALRRIVQERGETVWGEK